MIGEKGVQTYVTFSRTGGSGMREHREEWASAGGDAFPMLLNRRAWMVSVTCER